jgi:hypothetical protein
MLTGNLARQLEKPCTPDSEYTGSGSPTAWLSNAVTDRAPYCIPMLRAASHFDRDCPSGLIHHNWQQSHPKRLRSKVTFPAVLPT